MAAGPIHNLCCIQPPIPISFYKRVKGGPVPVGAKPGVQWDLVASGDR